MGGERVADNAYMRGTEVNGVGKQTWEQEKDSASAPRI